MEPTITDPDQQLLSVSEAARILTLSADGVRYLERTGEIAAVRTQGGVRLFRLGDVMALAVKRAAEHRGYEFRGRR